MRKTRVPECPFCGAKAKWRRTVATVFHLKSCYFFRALGLESEFFEIGSDIYEAWVKRSGHKPLHKDKRKKPRYSVLKSHGDWCINDNWRKPGFGPIQYYPTREKAREAKRELERKRVLRGEK